MAHHISFKHALDGIVYAYSSQPNMRIHFVFAILALLASWFFHITTTEFIIILFTISLVVVAEMINTALESMTDLITRQQHQNAKIAKDVSAGMVLVTATLSVITGLIIFTPYLINLF